MRKKILFIVLCLSTLAIAACGPSEEEKIKTEIAQRLRVLKGAPRNEAEVEERKALIEKLYKQKTADPLAIEKREDLPF